MADGSGGTRGNFQIPDFLGVARIEARDLEKLATTKMGPNDTSGVVWTLCEYFSFLLFRNADYYN
jgi:hypothetical protein